MFVDTGIITIYDLENDSSPLTCHRTDARDFLAHPSGRWSTSPDVEDVGLSPTCGKAIEDDSGEAMRLKAMTLKALQSIAEKAGISIKSRMKKGDLIDLILAQEKDDVDSMLLV